MNKHKDLVCMNLFVGNLNSYVAFKGFSSIKELAFYLDINIETIRSWIYYRRIPSIRKLDYIANLCNVYTHDLIGCNINFHNYNFGTPINNNSFIVFPINLRKYLNKNDIKSAIEFEYIMSKKVSIHTYYSYFKNSNCTLPSLNMLEYISHHLSIEPYKLIERTD